VNVTFTTDITKQGLYHVAEDGVPIGEVIVGLYSSGFRQVPGWYLHARTLSKIADFMDQQPASSEKQTHQAIPIE